MEMLPPPMILYFELIVVQINTCLFYYIFVLLILWHGGFSRAQSAKWTLIL